MTYTPKEWETGDIITASDLNNMETGIESGNSNVLYVTISGSAEAYQSDKTYAEIKSAYDAGKVIIVKDHVNYNGSCVGVINEIGDSHFLLASGSVFDPGSPSSIQVYTVYIGSDNTVTYNIGSCVIEA